VRYFNLIAHLRLIALLWCCSRIPVPFGLVKKLFDFGMGSKGKRL
jgi:hypothetical protein